MSDRTNGNGVVKLSLNVPALERLLGDDHELEVHLRDQVVKQVFEGRIDKVINTPAVQKLVDNVEAQVATVFRQECQKQIGTMRGSYSYNKEIDLSPEFKTLLATTIRTMLEPFVRGMVEEHAKKLTEQWLSMAEASIDKKINADIERRIKDGIDARLRAAAGGAA